MAESGAAGYDILASSRQSDRLFHVDLDSGLGRKPSALPPHLSRVLYLPKHSTPNLSLYDATVPYQKAINTSPLGGEHLVGPALMGSRLFKTRLNTMDREAAMHHAAPRYVVRQDVETSREDGVASATVRAQPSIENGGMSPEVNITLPASTDVFGLAVALDKDETRHMDISTTYPLQRVRTNAGVIRFPYFGFRLDDDLAHYEWQIHPLDHGTLRYTLFRFRRHAPTGGAAPPQQPRHENAETVAVYHHVGHQGSLFQRKSEGVLLLSAPEAEESPLLDVVVVASLVGLDSRHGDLARGAREGGAGEAIVCAEDAGDAKDPVSGVKQRQTDNQKK
ncbi:hypothetical protein E4U42_003629 [Claviceps africana]|uniref:Uncharacterized protein n=1 Tax=Claviceps africana TaxID=83212 RepID=A0A8K0JCB2_9HYPO|nr:hypothetical protein E4U42_003629 [Claviceps africana]